MESSKRKVNKLALLHAFVCVSMLFGWLSDMHHQTKPKHEVAVISLSNPTNRNHYLHRFHHHRYQLLVVLVSLLLLQCSMFSSDSNGVVVFTSRIFLLCEVAAFLFISSSSSSSREKEKMKAINPAFGFGLLARLQPSFALFSAFPTSKESIESRLLNSVSNSSENFRGKNFSLPIYNGLLTLLHFQR